MSFETGPRILRGEVIELFRLNLSDGGPPEERALVDFSSMRGWEIPLEMFRQAGYNKVSVGDKVSAVTETPCGLVPKSLAFILPPVG